MQNLRIEQYWPEEGPRNLDELYVWFHDKKAKSDSKLHAGDRFLFYEVARRPDRATVRGSKTLFASGTLTDERRYIPPEKQLIGGKRWLFLRKIITDFAVPPQEGIPLKEVKRILGRGWPQQGFKLDRSEFDRLEAALIQRQERSNLEISRNTAQRRVQERPFDSKASSKFVDSGTPIDTAERTARLEKSYKAHMTILARLDDFLKRRGFITSDNAQVDLFANRGDESWIFEVKSTHDGNLLSQVRHGLSQLYEYRYRYRVDFPTVQLCLVLQTMPSGSLAWLLDYLVRDRGIQVCWSVPSGFSAYGQDDAHFLSEIKKPMKN